MPHMPTRECFCEAIGQTDEVSQRLSGLLGSWGELCQCLGTGSGKSPAGAPIRRLISQSAVLTGKGAGAGGRCGWAA
jgi:hypothetical protein